MKIGAYVLAADPTWITQSIGAYYDVIDVLLVSYDSSSKSWSGTDIPVAECVDKVREVDKRSIMVELSGDYSTIDGSPMDRDTKQRQDCVNYLSSRVDWILQIDTDEWIPDINLVIRILNDLPQDICGIEWPMRVLYRKLGSGSYLAISDLDSKPVYEYPGPIIVRSNETLIDARRISNRIIRYAVRGDTSSLQLSLEHTVGVTVNDSLTNANVIIHNSWARSPKSVWRKISSWSHNDGCRSLFYFFLVWLPSPFTWRTIRNIHPFAQGLWPKLSILNVEGVSSDA
jgi:hypothetical protein